MADKKEPSQAQKFFVQHGEKVALGVAAALLVGYLVYSFMFTSENPDALRLRGLISTTDTEKTKEHTDLAPQKGAGLQSTALAPYTSTSQADAANPWATSYPTTGNVTVKEIDLEKETATMLASVTMVSKADVAIDGITIKFNAGTVDTKEYNEAAIDNFIIERKGKDGKWEVLDDKVKPDAVSYVDRALDPKTEYTYRVRPVTSDPKWKKESGHPDGIGNPSNEVSARSLGIWNFTIISATAPKEFDEPGTGSAYILIEKFDKQHGKVEIKRIHKVGEKIGEWDGKTLHRVSLPGGKSIEVDFGSGALLKGIEAFKVDVKFKRCVPQFDKSTGTKTGCETKEDTKSISGVKIVMLDEDGKPVTKHRPEPVAEDQFCEEHGGRKAPAVAPSADKDKEAQKLLAQADQEFEKDKKKAAAMYKKLLDTFGATDTVKNNKKKIEDRSK